MFLFLLRLCEPALYGRVYGGDSLVSVEQPHGYPEWEGGVNKVRERACLCSGSVPTGPFDVNGAPW
jgi:hypothetical protein